MFCTLLAIDQVTRGRELETKTQLDDARKAAATLSSDKMETFIDI